VADLVEGLTTEWFCAFLMISSRNVVHFVWLFYIFHVVLTAGVGVTVRNFIVVISGPAAVAVFFGAIGSTGPALVAALGGVIGIAFYLVVGQTYDQLDSSRRREAQLRNSLANLQVAEERVRIARDLHDGVAAELSALVWRARVLAQDGNDRAVSGELLGFEKRVLTALDQLRHVVFGLRKEPESWTRATALLRERCTELTRDIELEFTAEGEIDPETNSNIWRATEHIVLELERNAVQHARGRKVEVRIRATRGDLRIEVTDDGRGMEPSDWKESRGGLANVRARVGELLGTMMVESDAGGTCVRVCLPCAPPQNVARDLLLRHRSTVSAHAPRVSPEPEET
jgi:signal transduction histidine kinase